MNKRVALVIWAFVVLAIDAQFEWQAKDQFDAVDKRLRRITPDNCKISSTDALYLPEGSISHLPDIKDFDINPQFPNRSSLVLLHNMALTRSFFWSYVLQTRFIRPAVNDTYDPGMHYYFLSTIADVASNPIINASAIYFAPNMSYSPSYRGFFNKTFPRFAPRTYRADDYNDPVHLERTSSMNTFVVNDLGAFKTDSSTNDYTTDHYQINEWYKKWLPDMVSGRHDTKTTYNVEIRYANNTNETFSFHGPLAADEFPGPLQWTRPYFDCGRSNKWIVAAVVPIADIYPRHTGFRHIEYPRYTAISVLELDYDRIDINQCPPSEGNNGPNIFSSTANCKEKTTECEPLDGWGFRRGGYQCRCQPGYRLPFYVRRPYLGEIIERSTEEAYKRQFGCEKIGWLHKIPVKWEVLSDVYREQILLGHDEYRNETSELEYLHAKRTNIHKVLNFIRSMDGTKCLQYDPKDLTLPGEYAYNADKQFVNEARMAVRLANFISSFLQINDPKAIYSEKRLADKPLTEDQMIAETVALVVGNSKIQSAGIFWDRKMFTNRTFFAPFAYKKHRIDRKFYVEDLARFWNTSEVYTKKTWFRDLKRRWTTNQDSLDEFTLKIKIRHSENGEFLQKFENYPIFYRAAKFEHGMWSDPFYDCKSRFPKWTITYSVPFFGHDKIKEKLQFKGIVSVNMDLLDLDINQCSGHEYEANKFKNTHKCDRKSSTCVPLMGRGYDAGGYKCECNQGYEYPFEDPITYIDGQLLESEFWNLVRKSPSRFDMLKCRLATDSGFNTAVSARNFHSAISLVSFAIIFSFLLAIQVAI